jgi:acetylornithine deacetylase/succinyl-diaminopimelate desuccinylase-like protein
MHDVYRLFRATEPRRPLAEVLDEMGKFLEGATGEGTDIHLFQELAEAAGRCEGRMVILGILHQAFEQYASRLGREVQDEWANVQGGSRAGVSSAQVATGSWAELDLRIPPGLTVAAIEEAMAAALSDRGRYRLEKLKGWEPNWTPIASPIVEAVGAAATYVRKRQPDLVIRLPGSDAARWRAKGVSVDGPF